MKIIKIDDINYPKSLLKIKNPPKKLYLEGNEKLLNQDSLAIVGSRRCSQYGIKYAKIFAREISKQGITIISGLATGIDSASHKGALEYIGNTIAVLGSGINNIFPKENEDLAIKIIKSGGCVISEYKPNEEANMHNFPKRNRIISGLAKGVLVVEANYRSGSSITAKYGFEQNKKVFCLPRDLGVTNGIGTNNLIKLGASLVTSPNDILQEFGKSSVKEEILQEIEEIEIKKEYQDVYNLLSYEPTNIEVIKAKSTLPVSIISQKLVMLELENCIKSLPGNYYIRV